MRNVMRVLRIVVGIAPVSSLFVAITTLVVVAGIFGIFPVGVSEALYFLLMLPSYFVLLASGFAPGGWWWPPLVSLLLCAALDIALFTLGPPRGRTARVR